MEALNFGVWAFVCLALLVWAITSFRQPRAKSREEELLFDTEQEKKFSEIDKETR